VKPVIDAPLAIFIVRLEAALSAPVRMAAADEAVIAAATLTIIAVLSVDASYPAAVASVRIL
jgi:hypothetical protein